mgnify:FL=1|jgi:hypothetical protein|tara:strand:+ start:634 stop:876 length:243 start_codon:yes stop_codon:yes gene_type:complete
MKKIKDEELKYLQDLNIEFNKIKTQLGDITLQEHGLVLQVQEIKLQFQQAEKGLMETYGENAVINLETGEVKDKKDGEDK